MEILVITATQIVNNTLPVNFENNWYYTCSLKPVLLLVVCFECKEMIIKVSRKRSIKVIFPDDYTIYLIKFILPHQRDIRVSFYKNSDELLHTRNTNEQMLILQNNSLN